MSLSLAAAAAIAGGVGAGSDIIGNSMQLANSQWQRDFEAAEAVKQRQFNAAEAVKQRNWEEYMSGSAYQRAAQDMKKTGFNPLVMASMSGQGSAASTPAGSSATSSAAGRGGQSFNPSSNAIQAMGDIMNAKTSAQREQFETMERAKARDDWMDFYREMEQSRIGRETFAEAKKDQRLDKQISERNRTEHTYRSTNENGVTEIHHWRS